MTESERNKRTIAKAGIMFGIWEKLYGFDAAMRMAVEDAKEARFAADTAKAARAARPKYEVIMSDSADMRRSFIHDGHDPRARHSLGT